MFIKHIFKTTEVLSSHMVIILKILNLCQEEGQFETTCIWRAFNVVGLQVWSLDQQPEHHLGIC